MLCSRSKPVLTLLPCPSSAPAPAQGCKSGRAVPGGDVTLGQKGREISPSLAACFQREAVPGSSGGVGAVSWCFVSSIQNLCWLQILITGALASPRSSSDPAVLPPGWSLCLGTFPQAGGLLDLFPAQGTDVQGRTSSWSCLGWAGQRGWDIPYTA